jgi:hypothetical protein
VSVPAAALGLVAAQDELDALSANNDHLDSAVKFALLFSVDRDTIGVLPPSPAVAVTHPYNVFEQASILKVQEAGDQYMTINRFTLAGGIQPPPNPSRAVDTNTLIRNQYNEGGSDFGGQPLIAASASNAARASAPLDEVDATMLTSRSSREVAEVYFSVSNLSPSPWGLFNGATIFYDSGPAGAGPTTVYTWAFQLGLVEGEAGDDIDALIVFDAGEPGSFDAGDMVLFSLEPGSPSLATIPGASPVAPAADVFVFHFGDVSPSVFARAVDLGLGASPDNVDALDYVVCELESGIACAEEYGIRRTSIPAVSEWGLLIMALLGLVAGTIMFRVKRRTEPA